MWLCCLVCICFYSPYVTNIVLELEVDWACCLEKYLKTEAHSNNIHLDTIMSVSLQSKDGKTPLHMTAIHGRFSRSQAIIENGELKETFDLAGFFYAEL